MLKRAQEIAEQLVAWRRDFHQHPELGFQENRTAGRVADVMRALGYRVRKGVGRTGVVAELGQGPPVIALRADMDALPIQDEKDVPYASRVPGVMHACGHDAHTAIALGVATLLARESFPGTVRFLFQPAEEIEDDEGLSGASRMIEDGALDGVDTVLALHVDSAVPVGYVELEAGTVAAGVDTLYAAILGQGGHGATPHKVVDPIFISGHVILALHGIISRRLPPHAAAVISIGSIHGGSANNIIPERVDLSVTIRFREPEIQERLHAEIERALKLTRTLGGDYESRFVTGYPPQVNDANVTKLVRKTVTDLLGADRIRVGEPQMGSEDFAFFSDLAPGAMFMLGCRMEDGERRHHHPRFDVDERCLPIGVAILAEAALRALTTKG